MLGIVRAGILEETLNLKQTLLIAVAGLSLAAGTVNAQLVVHIGQPPKHDLEKVPPPPHPGMAWVAGYYRWNGTGYEWVRGEYRRPPHPGEVWVAGEWRAEGGGFLWHEGYWH